jgi:hypothetical protein
MSPSAVAVAAEQVVAAADFPRSAIAAQTWSLQVAAEEVRSRPVAATVVMAPAVVPRLAATVRTSWPGTEPAAAVELAALAVRLAPARAVARQAGL